MADMIRLFPYGQLSFLAPSASGVPRFVDSAWVPLDEDAFDVSEYRSAEIEVVFETGGNIPATYDQMGVEVILLESDMKQSFTTIESSRLKFEFIGGILTTGRLTATIANFKRFLNVQVQPFVDDAATPAPSFEGTFNLKVVGKFTR